MSLESLCTRSRKQSFYCVPVVKKPIYNPFPIFPLISHKKEKTSFLCHD